MYIMKNFNNIEKKLKFYGGNAGTKLAFVKENGETWFLKFAKTTKNLENVELSYTTSPLSEFLGSHIYQILGYETHETELGFRGNEIVVACKDFTNFNNELYELKTIVNDNMGNEEKLRENYSSDSSYSCDIEELNLVFKYNDVFKNNPKFIDSFFDIFIVDSFINNNDRHLGNIGFLINSNEKSIKLAPIYDNGNSFFTKHNEEKIDNILKNSAVLNSIINNNNIPYTLKGKSLDSIKIIKQLSFGKDDKNNSAIPEFDKKLSEAIIRVVPKLAKNRDKINNFIKEIPEKCNELTVMSKKQKMFYSLFLNERLDKILTPALEKTMKLNKESKGWGARVSQNNKFDITD